MAVAAPRIFRRALSVRRELVPHIPSEGGPPPRKKMTLQRLMAKHASKTPLTMLTAYDFPTARHCEAHDIDICLVGDSLAQVCLGLASTTQLTLSEMLHHVKAVARGAASPFIVADMPFGSYIVSPEQALQSAIRLVQEGGAEGVKVEGGEELAETVRALVRAGIPVIAHVGLTPQRQAALSGYKVQGRDAESAVGVLRAARTLQDAGAWSIVLEAIPAQLAEDVTARLRIPTIGIGAGPHCSGQVLVWDDAMGVWSGHKARFVRRFAELGKEAGEGVDRYAQAVRKGEFPDLTAESYKMLDGEWERYVALRGD